MRARNRRDPEAVPSYSWESLVSDGTHDVRRLDSVIRFSSIPVTFSESTAAHSFWVSLYSLMIWQTLECTGWKRLLPSLEEVLRHAVTHDIGESVTGDVVRTLKYSSKEMKEAVDNSEKLLVATLLPHGVRRTVPASVSPSAKAIVKAADFLSLWQFMRREAARHNLEIIPYYERMLCDLRAAATASMPMLEGLYRKMVVEAQDVATDCFGRLADSPRWRRTI